MKKSFAILLIAVSLLASLFACDMGVSGGGSSSSQSSSDGDSSSLDSGSYSDSSTDGADEEGLLDMEPVFAEDGSVSYGLYPQSRVSDEGLISSLSGLEPSSINGWYLYGGEYYAKATANVYNGEAYFFNDGSAIIDGEDYWFKCEPILWQILRDEDGYYYLLSTFLLDAQPYYTSYESRVIDGKTVYPNDYAQSSIRSWLNGEFYSVAFAVKNCLVEQVNVDNGSATTEDVNNPYASSNTLDKVFLPSYKDVEAAAYLNADVKIGRTTDYARATGAWCHTRNNKDEKTQANGSYWTRSPSKEYSYCATVINAGGKASSYAVDDGSHSVRPVVCIKVSGEKG